MTGSGALPFAVIETADIRTALQSGLQRRGLNGTITRIDRRPSPYASSFALEELDVELADGLRLALMLKNLNPRAMNEDARRVKPDFLLDPQREIAVYRAIVDPMGLGAALFAASVDGEADGRWLAIERIDGRELYQVGELEIWTQVAHWLGVMHRRLAALDLDRLKAAVPLVVYDAAFYDQWLHRAARIFDGQSAEPQASRDAFEYVRGRHHRMVDRLLALPHTVIHGEFYASNVLTAARDGDLRVCPVDWEMAALAPGLIDLAALTLGQWSVEDRRGFMAAYLNGLAADAAATSIDELAEAVDYCQIHLAVQWLGWFGTHPPHPSHARDWLGEAVERVDRLSL